MTINTADLTTESVAAGTGVFDVLMRTVKAHLKEEFDSNRIKGNDYAQAYVTLMATAMQVSIQYAVSKPESDAKIDDMLALRPTVLATATANKVKIEKETALLITQDANMKAMHPSILATSEATQAKTEQEVNLLVAQIADAALMRPSILATSEATQLKTEQEVELLEAQTTKTEEEVELVWEKRMTERANTQDMIFPSRTSSTHVPVNGVVGKQKVLYTNQADGYINDHKVKVGKIYADIAAVQLSSTEAYSTGYNGLSDSNISTVMSTLRNSM